MSTADDMELRQACEAAIDGGAGNQKVVLSICVAKSRCTWGKAGELGPNMRKPRVLAITVKEKGQGKKAFLQPTKNFKLKHLSKVEIVQNDPSSCTFILGFDNLKSQSVAPPQWTTRNKDDINHAPICIFNMSKEILGCLPKVVGMDIVEMTLWEKENTSIATNQVNGEDGPCALLMSQNDSQVTVEIDHLISQVEREETKSLLDIYLMGTGGAEASSERLKQELLALEAANLHGFLESEPVIEEALQQLEMIATCVEDMEEWLCVFNVKLGHMIEDIESIESRNNKLEWQSVNKKLLIKELDKLLERFQIPAGFEASLTGGSFDEANMVKNIEACEWLTCTLKNFEAPNLDPSYMKMRAVKEKLAELVQIKCTFVCRASEFLRNYFPSLIDCMLSDKNNFSERGQLKRPDHSDFRYKCRTYARLVQHIKNLDKNSLGPLREAYCHSLNLLLRREAHEFADKLRLSVKVPKVPIVWLEGPIRQATNTADSSIVSESYSKMLTVFIPLLVDESSFFMRFMCSDVVVPSQLEDPVVTAKAGSVNSDLNESSQIKHAHQDSCFTGLRLLNKGMQKYFLYVVDWACEIDPLRCISMHGITKRYLSGQKADTAVSVHMLLVDLEKRISLQFNMFIDDACKQIENYEHNVQQIRVLPYISRFVVLATRMEQYIHGQARDLIDHAYKKLVRKMFDTLESTAKIDSKYADIVLLENYAAFQNSIYDLAKLVPTLANFYYEAAKSYEQACSHYISMVIDTHFGELFKLVDKLKGLPSTLPPEEFPSQIGMSKVEFQTRLKTNLSEPDKTFKAMHRKFQKDLTAEELLIPLWDKCKKQFLLKYEDMVELVVKIYPSETILSVGEMKDVLTSL